MLDPNMLDGASDYLLAGFAGQRPPAPDWYQALRERRPEELRVSVDGAEIEVLGWGDRGRPGLLLVHGNRAHARWWGPVAPLLAENYRVVSVSLSGSGGSSWRDRYSSHQHAMELRAAAAVAGLGESECRPIVVAHSFGGIAAASLARANGAELAGVVFVDSLIMPLELRSSTELPYRSTRLYPDLASALSRFRLAPSQPCDAPYILDDVARAGLVEEAGGWRWRFDPKLFHCIHKEDPWPVITNAQCRIGFVYGERSPLAKPAIISAQRAAAPHGSPVIGIPAAHHHIMFDQPIALVAALRTIASSWFAAEIDA